MAKSQQGEATVASNNANNAITGVGNAVGGLNKDISAQQGNIGGTVSNIQGVGSEMGGEAQGEFGKASSGYGDMAATGGFTPEQQQQYLAQATSGVANSYDVLKQQAALSGLRTGGTSTGAAISQMARQGAQAQAAAMQQGQVNLNQQINANKLQGLGGEAGLYSTAQGGQLASQAQQLQGLGLENQNLSTELGGIGTQYGTTAAEVGNQANAAKSYNPQNPLEAGLSGLGMAMGAF